MQFNAYIEQMYSQLLIKFINKLFKYIFLYKFERWLK